MAQEVSISSELSIRNYYAYELLGRIDNRYLVYRDKGFLKEVDVFNDYMEHTQHSELIFEKKKTDVFSTVGLDSMFQLIYGYVERDTVVIKMRRYNNKVSLVDSNTITQIPKSEVKRRINSVLSEDKSKVLIYTLDSKFRFHFFLYNNQTNRLIVSKKLEFPPNIKIKKNLNDVILTNEGNLLMSFYDNDEYSNNKNGNLNVFHYKVSNGETTFSEVDFGKNYRQDTYLDYDNYNKQIVLCGLYSKKKSREGLGLYLLSKPLSNLLEKEVVSYIPFSTELVEEVSRTKKKKSRIFENFEVNNIVKRQDGGILIMMELAKEYSRRSSYSTSYDSRSSGPRRGWVDYYNEDIIVTSINPDQEVDWSRILYKKQFSQDDDAVFSSYYIMKTPSRMRLIYNDEIKRDNTVSEYLIDPTGQVARNSLLSTDDQDLKLRFRDAIQISNVELIVPSESNYELNLVKIRY